jgi:hypothetical protein
MATTGFDGLSAQRSSLQTFFAFNDGPWRWAAGVQAAFANALPMAMFSLTGHLSLGLVASLGAFTALYGTKMPLRERLRVLPLVAIGFVAASLLGVRWLVLILNFRNAKSANFVLQGRTFESEPFGGSSPARNPPRRSS